MSAIEWDIGETLEKVRGDQGYNHRGAIKAHLCGSHSAWDVQNVRRLLDSQNVLNSRETPVIEQGNLVLMI
jgi:hypothetical protein